MGKTKASKKNVKKVNKKKKTEKTRSVYIVISKTSTLPSNVIKMWTKEPYAHKRLHNPFDCGFISEDITTGVFGRDVDTVCRVCRLPITTMQYKKLIKNLDKFKANKAAYKYNYLGIFGIMFNKAVERKYNYFCSQFVFYILQKSGVKMFNKKPGLVRPEDFRTWNELEVIYEGKLNKYREFLMRKKLQKNETKDVKAVEDARKQIAVTAVV